MSTIEPADTALPNHNNQKKIALINDFTGFGRCSVAVQLPVISQLGVQCCVLPTSVLSNHTGFPSYSFQDFTPYMREHIREWRKLGLKFRGICTGFLGSAEQIAVVSEFIDEFGGPDCIVMVDPVMGDEGHPYGTYTPERCERMAELTAKADIITPNITEVALLLDEPFTPRISPEEIKGRLRRLSAMGPQTVVATSVPLLEGGRDPGQNTSVIAYERDEDRFWRIDCAYIPAHYPGTGDTFSSVLTGSLIQGDSLSIALDRAVQFVTLGIRATFGQGLPSREGILLERILGSLFAPVSTCKCRIMDGDGCCNPVLPFED